MLSSLRAGLGGGLWESVAWLALGWLLVRLVCLPLSRPLAALEAGLWRAVAGVRLVRGLPAPSASRLANGEAERETALLLSAALGARLGPRLNANRRPAEETHAFMEPQPGLPG